MTVKRQEAMNSLVSTLVLLAASAATKSVAATGTRSLSSTPSFRIPQQQQQQQEDVDEYDYDYDMNDVDDVGYYESEPVLQVDENHLFEQYFQEHLQKLESSSSSSSSSDSSSSDDELKYEDPNIDDCQYTLEYMNGYHTSSSSLEDSIVDIERQTYRCDSGFALLNDVVLGLHDGEGFYFRSLDRQLLISGIHVPSSQENSYSNCILMKQQHEHAFFPSLNELDAATSDGYSTVEEFVNESYCYNDDRGDNEDHVDLQQCTGRSYFEIYAYTWYKIVYRSDCNQFEVLHCGDEDGAFESCQ